MFGKSVQSDTALHPRLLLIILLICTLAYFRGLFGGFVFDDFGSIVDNPALRGLDGSVLRWIVLAVSNPAGILRRPISMMSFGLDYTLFGLSPLAFKLTNLAIHLGNGALLYALAKRLAPRLISDDRRTPKLGQAIALFATALWLLHPLNVSDVVYIVQRMNLLATLFMLGGLICYAEGRERMARGEPGMVVALAGLCVFGLLAVFSKENGALIFAYALVIEAICYRFGGETRQRRLIIGFFCLSVALPMMLCFGWITFHPQWLIENYSGRSFTLDERLLSEPRVLCNYLLWIFVPNPSWMGMYHEGIVKSIGFLNPLTTLPAMIFLIALAAAAWMLRRRNPGFAFAVAWFFAGHSMESTFLPLELVFEHRNYFPMAGLFVGIACATMPWILAHLGKRRTILACSTLALICGGLTAVRANNWGDPLRLALSEVSHHPDSSRAQYEAGRWIIFNGTANDQREAAEAQAIPYFERGAALDPTDIFTVSSLMIIHGRNGVPIAQEDVADLARRVSDRRQIQINPVLMIMAAAANGNLRLTSAEMETLVHAALENPSFLPTMRAMVLSNYAHYQFQILHNTQTAVGLTVAAAAEDPGNPLFQIHLAKLALELKQLGKATEYLGEAQRLNKAGFYDQMIDDLKQRIETAARKTD